MTGWGIAGATEDADERDAEALYDTLGGTVLPLWHGDQARWNWMMKQAIARIGSRFHSQRMRRCYAAEAHLR